MVVVRPSRSVAAGSSMETDKAVDTPTSALNMGAIIEASLMKADGQAGRRLLDGFWSDRTGLSQACRKDHVEFPGVCAAWISGKACLFESGQRHRSVELNKAMIERFARNPNHKPNRGFGSRIITMLRWMRKPTGGAERRPSALGYTE
jgi:hypothetical protein